MRFTVEIQLEESDPEFTAEMLADLSGLALKVSPDLPYTSLPVNFFGRPVRGKVIGASKSPRDRTVRLVIADSDSG